MGCDIHSFLEVRKDGKWEVAGEVFPLSGFDLEWSLSRGRGTHTSHPFNWRSYGMFGFLANVRNYSHVPCIQEPTFKIPEDVSPEIEGMREEYAGDYHSHSHLTLRQLIEYDYDQKFWDRRVTKQTGPNSWTGAGLAEEREGETIVLRDFLGKHFFEQIEIMKTLGDPDEVRVIFWFDN